MASERRDDPIGVIADVFRSVIAPPPSIVDEGSTMENLQGWDSLTHIALMTALEKRFAVKLTLSELRKLTSVSAIAALLRAKGV